MFEDAAPADRRSGPKHGPFAKAAVAIAVAVPLSLVPANAAETIRFWDLKPDHLRVLIASPQVMVTRTEDGFDAYCRCGRAPARRNPPIMKAAITAVEDKRYFDHGGIDIITLLSVLRGGFDRGEAPSRCSC